MTIRQEVLEALFGLLREAMQAPRYNTEIAELIWFDEAKINSREYKTPLLVMTDTGSDKPLLIIGGKGRFAADVLIASEVEASATEDAGSELSGKADSIIEELRSRVIEKPTLHENILGIRWVGVDSKLFSDKAQLCWTRMMVRVIYYVEYGSMVNPALPASSGPESIKGGGDKLVALMEALALSLSTGHKYGFSYVHPTHLEPALRLNAVTVQFERIERGAPATGHTYEYDLYYEIRVHTGYTDDFVDPTETGAILQSVLNKLQANFDLGNGYLIMDIADMAYNQEFQDSGTIGARLVVNVHYTESVEQEITS